jgi:hypothetical protein
LASLTFLFQQLEKAEQEKYDLQRRLKIAEGGGAYAAQKVRFNLSPQANKVPQLHLLLPNIYVDDPLPALYHVVRLMSFLPSRKKEPVYSEFGL